MQHRRGLDIRKVSLLVFLLSSLMVPTVWALESESWGEVHANFHRLKDAPLDGDWFFKLHPSPLTCSEEGLIWRIEGKTIRYFGSGLILPTRERKILEVRMDGGKLSLVTQQIGGARDGLVDSFVFQDHGTYLDRQMIRIGPEKKFKPTVGGRLVRCGSRNLKEHLLGKMFGHRKWYEGLPAPKPHSDKTSGAG